MAARSASRSTVSASARCERIHSTSSAKPRRLIVDLRDNDGGDFNVGRAFIEGIRSQPWLNQRGVLYVMIGGKTFSAANQLARRPITGRKCDDGRFHLPNSGLRVSVSMHYDEFLRGESESRPPRGARAQ